MVEDANPELENFRKQWQEEVTARSRGGSSKAESKVTRPAGPARGKSGLSQPHQNTAPSWSFASVPKEEQEILDGLQTQSYHDLEDKDEAQRLGTEGKGVHPESNPAPEPSSALEHYEKAVEREIEGNLGDSLSLYRKAFRLDAGVDRIYKNKHFPPSSFTSKATNPNPSNAPITVPNPAHHSLDGPPQTSTTSQLIASFALISIPPADPPTEQSLPPPCAISAIPSELLVEVLLRTAIADVASFARLALVCKRLAYLVATEDRIWKRVCLGSEFGFGAMHYKWVCSISGSPLLLESSSLSFPILDAPTEEQEPLTSLSLFPLSLHPAPTHKSIFRSRPRLRFNGCYISTVNYIRPGASTPSQVSWNTPVHIVTYYRYLRLFRDGSCCSLLTTAEPADVVHHLSRENMGLSASVHNKEGGILPGAVMRHALRGRWRLSGRNPLHPLDTQTPGQGQDQEEQEGTLHIETHGVDPSKYIYKLELSLQSSGPRHKNGVRNNRLAWKGFWSYNKLTDDWAEFSLRNDKPFFWSRVGSYGMGIQAR